MKIVRTWVARGRYPVRDDEGVVTSEDGEGGGGRGLGQREISKG